MATSAINTEKWKTEINVTVTDIKEVKAFINIQEEGIEGI